jgi:hypothetical protein
MFDEESRVRNLSHGDQVTVSIQKAPENVRRFHEPAVLILHSWPKDHNDRQLLGSKAGVLFLGSQIPQINACRNSMRKKFILSFQTIGPFMPTLNSDCASLPNRKLGPL